MDYNLAVFLVRVVVTQSLRTCGFWYGFVCSIFGFSCIFYNLAVFLVRVVTCNTVGSNMWLLVGLFCFVEVFESHFCIIFFP